MQNEKRNIVAAFAIVMLTTFIRCALYSSTFTYFAHQTSCRSVQLDGLLNNICTSEYDACVSACVQSAYTSNIRQPATCVLALDVRLIDAYTKSRSLAHAANGIACRSIKLPFSDSRERLKYK